ncbi:Radial spoke head 10 B [Phytophthora cinnamomi]|uniref:Radial spoke head 10 B n=1 Tax=Phytophthora cinnamomi TaxID=4785 RepID=UPI00355A89B7|nr:Radial spoke head 10 B [Phytophthora cinnamomi]
MSLTVRSLWPGRKKPRKETPEETRQRYLREILRRELEDKKRVEREMHNLVKQINALILKDRKSLVAYQRRVKDEDPRCVFYYRMLRRVGLPEVHARFAPWFLKSNQIQLNRWSAVLFNRLEQAFFAVPEQLSTVEIRMLAHQKHYDAIMKPPPADLAAPDPSKALEPRQKSQILLQRAFRDCSFHVDEDITRKRQQQAAITGVKKPPPKPKNSDDNNNQEDEVDKLEIIPEVAVLNAPPGLAPQVRGQLESHGKHIFYTYNGRWKDGEMHGGLGVYSFADGGKYRGEFVHNTPSGNGTVVYPNGVKYTGTFVDGKFHGFGVMEMERGFSYEGEFLRGQRCGLGKLQMHQSGAVYEDLQYAFWDAEEARMEREEEERIDNLKRTRREKREAQAAAKKAFMEQVQREANGSNNEGNDDGDDDDDDEDADEDADDDGASEGDGDDDEEVDDENAGEDVYDDPEEAS